MQRPTGGTTGRSHDPNPLEVDGLLFEEHLPAERDAIPDDVRLSAAGYPRSSEPVGPGHRMNKEGMLRGLWWHPRRSPA